jgi:hypothetical protein
VLTGGIVVALVSLIAGWLLAQLTGLAKDRLKVRQIHRSLLAELRELHVELGRTLLIYARQLQIHALKGIDVGIPLKLSNHIFRNYYKDVVLSLNEAQRISFQMINTHIEELNAEIVEFRALTTRLLERSQYEGVPITDKEGERWGKTVMTQFSHAAETSWHIRHHLSNAGSPEMGFKTRAHQEYLQYLQGVEDEIQKLLLQAKQLNRADFERIYNPNDFVNAIMNPKKIP